MLTKKNKNITGPSMIQDQIVMVGICVEALQKKNNLFSCTRSGTRDITAEWKDTAPSSLDPSRDSMLSMNAKAWKGSSVSFI